MLAKYRIVGHSESASRSKQPKCFLHHVLDCSFRALMKLHLWKIRNVLNIGRFRQHSSNIVYLSSITKCDIPHKQLKQGRTILRANPCFPHFHGSTLLVLFSGFFSYHYIEQQQGSMEINLVPAKFVPSTF